MVHSQKKEVSYSITHFSFMSHKDNLSSYQTSHLHLIPACHLKHFEITSLLVMATVGSSITQDFQTYMHYTQCFTYSHLIIFHSASVTKAS